MKKVVLAFSVTVLYLAILKTTVSFYSADLAYVNSQNLANSVELTDALFQSEKAVGLNPSEPRYYLGKAKILILLSAASESERNRLKGDALQNIETAISINPKNLVTIRNSIPLYFFLAVGNLTKSSAENNLDPEFAKESAEIISWMKNSYPNDLGVQVLAAKYEKRLGFTDMYKETVENIGNLRPDMLEWNTIFN